MSYMYADRMSDIVLDVYMYVSLAWFSYKAKRNY